MLWRFLVGLFFVGQVATVWAGESRQWTVKNEPVLTAEYQRATVDSVTVRLGNLQNRIIKLDQLADADRAYVADQLSKEKEAGIVEGTLKGEIVWRLAGWNSLSWSVQQGAEVFLWDDIKKAPGEKLASLKVNYSRNSNNRNQFEGKYQTAQTVRMAKNARLVVKSTFHFSINGDNKDLVDVSVPFPLPTPADGVYKLPVVRATTR